MGIHLMDVKQIVVPVGKSSNHLYKQNPEDILQKMNGKKSSEFNELIKIDTPDDLKIDGMSIDEIIARTSAVNPIHNRKQVRASNFEKAENLYEKTFIYKARKAYEVNI